MLLSPSSSESIFASFSSGLRLLVISQASGMLSLSVSELSGLVPWIETSSPSLRPSSSLSGLLRSVPALTSSESLRPSLSESAFCGSPPWAYSSALLNPSLSLSRAASSNVGSRLLDTSQPSSMPSLSLSLFKGLVPRMLISEKSFNPSLSVSALRGLVLWSVTSSPSVRPSLSVSGLSGSVPSVNSCRFVSKSLSLSKAASAGLFLSRP